jgi:aspartyl/asparaginyl beta-hydroxylase (cupin superfamily)
MSNFLTSNDFTFLSLPEIHWQTIRDEFYQVEHRAEKWPPKLLQGGEQDATDGIENNNGKWYIVPLYYNGVKFSEDACPITHSCIKEVPNIIQAGFSIMEPGCEIYPHVGPADVYRSHLGLVCNNQSKIIVEGEEYTWQEGKVMAFNDLKHHHASNFSESNRVVLIMDFII